LPLSQRAHRIWERLPELIGTDGEYVRSGHFKIARSLDDMVSLERYRDAVREFNLGIELLSGERMRRLCPWLGNMAVGGSLCPEDGQANPRLVSPAFARAAQRAGAKIFERCPVDGIEFDGKTFHLRSGTAIALQAPRLLNCAGAWAGKIAAQFGEAVPMNSGYPAMAVTSPMPRFLDWSLGVEGGSVYCRQVIRGNVVLGGGQGRALDAVRACSTRDATVAIMSQAIELLPGLRNAQIIRTWSGTEGFMPDGEPVLGWSRTTRGLLHGFGFSGEGFQVGPAAGEVLAELVRDGASNTPIADFSIGRFAHPSSSSLAPERITA
jgi:sarcosine oxidase, subunit beta